MTRSTPRTTRSKDPSDLRIRRSWWTFSGAFLLLAGIVLFDAIAADASFADRLLLVIVVVAGVSAIVNGLAVGGLETRRRGEAESFARILSGLSRSVSPDAIVDAIETVAAARNARAQGPAHE